MSSWDKLAVAKEGRVTQLVWLSLLYYTYRIRVSNDSFPNNLA
jgi:hypothetical protein